MEAPPQEHAEEDDLPPWVTAFSDDSAVPAGADHIAGMPQAAPQQRAAVPAKAPYEYVINPVPELGWDGNWPALAAHLPLRGEAMIHIGGQRWFLRRFMGISPKIGVRGRDVPQETKGSS